MKKTAKIICEEAEKKGLDFYLIYDGEQYYLFNQRYRAEIAVRFTLPVPLDVAMTKFKQDRNPYIRKLIQKLPYYVHYIENEFNLVLLKRTARSRQESMIF